MKRKLFALFGALIFALLFCAPPASAQIADPATGEPTPTWARMERLFEAYADLQDVTRQLKNITRTRERWSKADILAGYKLQGEANTTFATECLQVLQEAEVELEKALAMIEELQGRAPPHDPGVRPPHDPHHPSDPHDPVDPDPPADPPVDPDPDPPLDPPATPPGFAFEGLPFDVPPIPAYRYPTVDDCDWIVANGRATSTRGLSAITGKDTIAAAYKASLSAGQELPITFGVRDNGGRIWPGGEYSQSNSYSLVVPDGGGGYRDISIEFLGLDDSCEISLGWSTRWGRAAYIGVFNLGLRGGTDSFVIRANDGIGKLVLDGAYWLPGKKAVYKVDDEGVPLRDASGAKIFSHWVVANHSSGLHVDNWETFIWRNHQWRGVLPTDPGIKVREHSVYLKSCVGKGPEAGTWIVGNNLKGGNRTGFQIRPERLKDSGGVGNAWPQGPVVVAYNYSDGYGFTHGNTGSTADGGSALTVWTNPFDHTYVFGNRITDARYGCLVLSAQKANRNYLNANGYPIRSVYLADNVFENRNGNRGCVSITSVEEVHFFADNVIQGAPSGDLTLGNPWVMNPAPLPGIEDIDNGQIFIHGADTLAGLQALRVKTYDPANPKNSKPVSDAKLATFLVE